MCALIGVYLLAACERRGQRDERAADLGLPAMPVVVPGPNGLPSEPGPPGARRPPRGVPRMGPVWITRRAVLVAPARRNGMYWDGEGRASVDVQREVRAPVTLFEAITLSRALIPGTAGVVEALTRTRPASAVALRLGVGAPDVRLVVRVNGQPAAPAGTSQNAFAPAWNQRHGPMMIGPSDRVELVAVDRDVLLSDGIGRCVCNGMPPVDERGYTLGDAFRCEGALWAASMRLAFE